MSTSSSVTPAARSVLEVVAERVLAGDHPPTVRELNALRGLSTASTSSQHLVEKLIAAGLVERPQGPWGARRPLTITPAGWDLLGLTAPERDAALGRALREAAAAGDPAAARVLGVLEVA